MPFTYLYNGEFVDQFSVGPDNRAFRYGDGVFETIRVRSGKVLWFRYHYQRILSSLSLLKMDMHPDFEERKLLQLLNGLIQKNKVDEGGRIRLSIYRKDGGLYTPLSNECDYFAEIITLDNNDYILNNNGLNVGYYKEHRKASTQISRIKTSNSLIYVLASLWASNSRYDDAFISNHYGRIAETTHSNLWIIKDDILFTPTLSEGALYGVMRRLILSNKAGERIVRELNLSIQEGSISSEDIQQADEVFLSNSIQGIQWVEKVSNKTFRNTNSIEIIRIINEFAEADLKNQWNE